MASATARARGASLSEAQSVPPTLLPRWPRVQGQGLGDRGKSLRAQSAFPSGYRRAAPRPHGSLRPDSPGAPRQCRGAGRVWVPRGLPAGAQRHGAPGRPKDPPWPVRCLRCRLASSGLGERPGDTPGGSPEEAAGRPRGPAAPARNE